MLVERRRVRCQQGWLERGDQQREVSLGGWYASGRAEVKGGGEREGGRGMSVVGIARA